MDTSETNFDCLCRTCMNEVVEASSCDGNTKPQWQSIFDRIAECGAFRIAEVLTNAVPQIEVTPSDELPNKICCKCLQQLLSVYRFQQMCVESEQKMRQQISKNRSDLEISMVGAAMAGETGSYNAGSYPMASFQPSNTQQNLEHTSIQDPLLETIEQVVKPEAAEISKDDIDQLLEEYKDAQGNFSEFLKNEPIEDDEPEMDDSDDFTIQSIISVKDDVWAVESEEQQIKDGTRRNRQNYHQDKDKTYECPSCPRRFNIYQNMYQHKATHEGRKRKDCDICGKSIIKNHLKAHKRTHNKVKPNKCDFCEKRFTRPTDLRTHMRIHTGEKPYKCKYCERSFSASGHRMKHMRNHLGDNVHRCELCPLAFPAPSELRKHLTTHKNEDPETRERNMNPLKEAEAELQEKLSKKSTQQPSKDEIKSKRNVKTHHIIQDEDLPPTYSSPQTHW